jgi:hypothetical protein
LSYCVEWSLAQAAVGEMHAHVENERLNDLEPLPFRMSAIASHQVSKLGPGEYEIQKIRTLA